MDAERGQSEGKAGTGGAGRHRVVAFACLGFALSMMAVAYAAVPLYSMFCSLTGFGGATRVGTAVPGEVLERTMTVRFDANVAPGLPWTFAPEQREVKVKVGETKMAFYRATSEAGQSTAGNATYNVTPAQAGFYFVKMQCFCFNEQELTANETLDMPVVFFIDPAIAQDEELKSVKTITLSYTFFPAPKAKPGASPATKPGAGPATKPAQVRAQAPGAPAEGDRPAGAAL